jgi:branched-chain amino acid transport system permease protein
MQVLLNGVISGLGIALLAVGFQLAYLPTRVFFIAIAGLYALCPYLYLSIAVYLGSMTAIVASLALIAGGSVLLERLNHAPLSHRGASTGVHLVASLGSYIVLAQAAAIIWGNGTRTLQTGVDPLVRFLNLTLTGSQLLTLCVSLWALLVLMGVLRRTDLGLRLRALADNPDQFALLGYDIDRYRAYSFGLAGLFAASAALLAARAGAFDPNVGLPSTLLAIVAVIVGGRTSFAGPVFGAILLGLIRAQVAWHFSARWEECATFGVLGLCLLLRPYGIFGSRGRTEVLAS